MSEQMKKLKEKAEAAKEYISVVDLPQELTAKLEGDLVFKVDKRGNECCFVTLITPEKKYIAQKYVSTQYQYLHDAIIKCGGLDNLKADFLTWRKIRVGRGINERLFPIPRSATKKKGD